MKLFNAIILGAWIESEQTTMTCDKMRYYDKYHLIIKIAISEKKIIAKL